MPSKWALAAGRVELLNAWKRIVGLRHGLPENDSTAIQMGLKLRANGSIELHPSLQGALHFKGACTWPKLDLAI